MSDLAWVFTMPSAADCRLSAESRAAELDQAIRRLHEDGGAVAGMLEAATDFATPDEQHSALRAVLLLAVGNVNGALEEMVAQVDRDAKEPTP